MALPVRCRRLVLFPLQGHAAAALLPPQRIAHHGDGLQGRGKGGVAWGGLLQCLRCMVMVWWSVTVLAVHGDGVVVCYSACGAW